MGRSALDNDPLHIRAAVHDDAERIAQVRHSAIRGIARDIYPQATLEAWAGALDEHRYQRFRDVIAGDQELVFVAERQSTIVGFGSLIPRKNEVRAVYVDAEYARRGTGAAILRQLESTALEFDCTFLTLQSSLNARNFYLSHGYIELARSDHTLGDAYAMASVLMRKTGL